MNDTVSFLGTGWAFPPEFSAGGRDVAMSADIEDIQQSLEILFGTRLGERIMQEDYGSSLSDFQFEEISAAELNRMQTMITEAVLFHEPRIELHQITIDRDGEREGLLLISLDFSVPATNSRFNMVYPFYLMEGNN